MSFRDRFLTPRVARAMTSPSAILATGAGAAVGVLAFANPVGAVVLGLGAYAARVLAAVPRAPRRPGIAPRTLAQPWRGLMEGALDARARYDRSVRDVRPGPLRDRLDGIGGRLDAAVDQAWAVASAGNTLAAGRARIDTAAVSAELARLQAGPRTPRVDQTVEAVEAQLAAAARLDSTISDTYDRLRLLEARVDETVTRAVELSVSQADDAELGGLGAEIDTIVGEMEALRQAVEETSGTGRSATRPAR